MRCPVCGNTGPPGPVTATGERESLVCLICGCTSRARAVFHATAELAGGMPEPGLIYQVGSDILTPHLRRYFTLPEWKLIVSEYAGGPRVEDVEQLSFADASLDIILCADVLEHVRLYRKALGEFSRILKVGGALILTVPGDMLDAEHLSWCAITDEERPETDTWAPVVPVHLDPGDPAGCRQYRNFSYPRLLRELAEVGLVGIITPPDDLELGIVNSSVIIGRKT